MPEDNVFHFPAPRRKENQDGQFVFTCPCDNQLWPVANDD